MPFMRKIASNKLLNRDGLLLLNPLVELDEQGLIMQITTTCSPDCEPFTEFYAGLLVVGLNKMLAAEVMQSTQPLTEWLPSRLTDNSELWLLSSLDFQTLRPTPQTHIQRIGAKGSLPYI